MGMSSSLFRNPLAAGGAPRRMTTCASPVSGPRHDDCPRLPPPPPPPPPRNGPPHLAKLRPVSPAAPPQPQTPPPLPPPPPHPPPSPPRHRHSHPPPPPPR